VFETDTPHLAHADGNGLDGAAFAAWAGLRPMTELVFEKACRGPLKPVPNEYAWGTAAVAGSNDPGAPRDGYALRNPGQADESATWEGANGPDETRGNAAWNGTVKGEDRSFAVNQINRPLRPGIFATPESDRVAAGASYWGIMELSGNLEEAVVTVGNWEGRRFAGTHGDGAPEPAEGWKAVIVRGGGAGGRGDVRGLLRVSNRSARGMYGRNVRCVRTAP
jgi:hypothetical protein